ncbi:MSHA biogenesis protein MshI [Malonomonas rubra DSM 5091]|uniref:MSHA biogenesis protein MshI n=1 Tax=Malonomonas rubra DSM 5091 TaxID=1122189 RepID=A0A1M6M5D8_MALRU|nr:hypothetical protein [Malonomonas rubra]SHJ78686.1 MSHA biogenesis protein MshI [Malonomonas rubra DSM 5091]
MEAKLGFWNKKKSSSGAIAAVCQFPFGTSVASVQRKAQSIPELQHVSWDAAVAPQERTDALRSLVKQQSWQGRSAVSVLPPDFYQLMQIELAALPLEERRDAARWQVREMLEFPVEQAVVDIFDVAPFGGEKMPLSYVVAARLGLLRERYEMLSEADLDLTAIDIPEFALRNLTDLFAEQDDRGTAILYLEKQGGLLTIARDGIHYLTRYLTSGMDDLIPYADGDFEALTEQLDGIVLEVQRSFDYCESTYHLPMVSRLLVAQSEREIPAVNTYLNDYLATRVESFSFDSVLQLPEGVEQIELNRHLLAIGGALRQEGE